MFFSLGGFKVFGLRCGLEKTRIRVRSLETLKLPCHKEGGLEAFKRQTSNYRSRMSSNKGETSV